MSTPKVSTSKHQPTTVTAVTRRPTTHIEAAANRHVAQRIRQRRTEAGLTQEALAHNAGVHRTMIGRLERHEVNMTLGTVALIADALDTTISDLVEGV